MQVRNNSIFVGDETRTNRAADGKSKGQNSSSKSVNGAALTEKFDPIAAKRSQARKAAMKIIGDAFENEKKIDNDLDSHRQKIREIRSDIVGYKEEIRGLKESRELLRSEYGIDENSEEERQLKLLEKEADSRTKGSKVTLTREEMNEVGYIRAKGLTEYQHRAMELKESERYYADFIYDSENDIKTENAIISGSKIERLKYSPMLDARDQAEEIIESADKEILGMLYEEGKEHIDEEQEKKEEEAKAQREKKEELEEKIEKAKEKKKEQEEFTEDILEAVTDREMKNADISGAQEEIKEMMSKMKLLEEDVKGAAIDKEI
ncbi:MAG: hypothetical protein II741_03855 [Lachnospiraceae bacterium]|nr:hypothetical protein [Lachnospiraceae bacterium]